MQALRETPADHSDAIAQFKLQLENQVSRRASLAERYVVSIIYIWKAKNMNKYFNFINITCFLRDKKKLEYSEGCYRMYS